MCNFKTLYYEENGYLIVCEACNHFQLAFLSNLQTLSSWQLHILHKQVKQNVAHYGDIINGTQKCIYLPGPQEGCGMILNRKELQALFELLETAEVNYKAEQLLELFK